MIFWTILLIIIGVIALFKGAHLLVVHVSHLAARMGVTVTVVGLSVVALGNIMPELSVGITSSLSHANDLIIGNVLGSSVLKLGLVLGVAALIYPLTIKTTILRHEIPWLLLATVFFFFLAYDLTISRSDGVMLVALAIFFEWYSISQSRREFLLEAGKQKIKVKRKLAKYHHHAWFKIILGFLLLICGAKLFVDSSLLLAGMMHISQLFAGILVISIGTSLPELAVAIISAWHREPGLVIGDIIGSNIMNIFLVLGIATIINPIIVHPDLLVFDFPMLIFFTIIVSLMFKSHHRLSRFEGGLLVTGYIIYLMYSIKFWG